jgi:outer membrane protein assembly factor BamD (BamD/ComL family)
MLLCTRSRIAVLVAAGLATFFFLNAASAQETRIPSAAELTAADCTPELFERVDRRYRGRHFSSEALAGAEKYVRKMVEVCPYGSSDPVLQLELQTLEEELAEHSFYIGKFYFDRAQTGKNGLKGAQSRFLEIVEKYPHYSKIEDVLLLLCRTYELRSDPESYPGSQERLQELIKQFPSSPSRGTIETVLDQLKIREMVERVKEGR